MAVPEAPHGVRAEAADAAVNVYWRAPAGAPTSYTVKYGTTEGGPYGSTQAAASTLAVIEGLTNDTQYYFVVSATNGEGEGSDSAEVSATPAAYDEDSPFFLIRRQRMAAARR
jgi:hypothetical protein